MQAIQLQNSALCGRFTVSSMEGIAKQAFMRFWWQMIHSTSSIHEAENVLAHVRRTVNKRICRTCRNKSVPPIQ